MTVLANPLIEDLTQALYPGRGSNVADRITTLLAAYGRRETTRHQPGPQETILITYGDQLQAPGEHPLATLRQFCTQRVPFIDTVHLLPIFPYSSDDGFSVIDYLTVDPALGDWDDIQALARDRRLMIDAVVNHISAQSDWFAQYLAGQVPFRHLAVEADPASDLSAVVRPRTLPLLTTFETSRGVKHLWTTFSADQIDLNYADPDVLLCVIEVLLEYVARGASLIRLDAIAFIWKEPGTSCMSLPQTHQVVRLIRAVLDDVAPDVTLITETNVPHAENISYFGDGTNEAQLVYNFALPPLVLHTLGTGDSGAIQDWAATLETPSDSCWFFNFLASHDGIGLRGVETILTPAERTALADRAQAHGGRVGYRSLPHGEREPYELNINYFDALSDPVSTESVETQVARFLCAHSIMLTLPGVPGVYMHSLLGSRSDHDAVLRSGANRSINREKLWLPSVVAELDDPDSLRALVFTGLRHLLETRATCDDLSPGSSHRVRRTGGGLFAVQRKGLICVHNVTADPQPVPFGGVDELSGRACRPGEEIQGYGVLWLRA